MSDHDVRDHITSRLTAGRAKLEAKRSGWNFAVLVLGLVGAAFGAAFFFAQVAPTLIRSSYDVSFEVASARAVKPGLNEVRIKGVPVGRITGVDLEDGKAVVKASIENKYGAVYRDARAQLRPNSALEDQYLDVIDRGKPQAGEATTKTPLASDRTEVPVSVDAALSTFNAPTRTRLRILLDQLGTGVDGNGSQLELAFADLVPLIQSAQRLTDVLAERKPLTERLVHNVGLLTTELGRRDEQVRSLVANGAGTLSALDDSSPQLDATLRELPPTLTSLRTSLAATRGVVGDVDGALRDLRPVAGRLPTALQSVRDLTRDADPAVRALQDPVRRLVPLSGSLPPLSRSLSETVARLRPQVPVVDNLTKDLVECETGIKGFFQWDASLTKFGDARGQAPRGTLALGLQTAGLPSPDESAYQGCTPGGPIGGRAPNPQTDGR